MPDDLRVLHYSCGKFIEAEAPAAVPINYIEVHADNEPAVTFDCRGNEADALHCFALYLRESANATWLGWRCLRPDYGFAHLAARYFELTGECLPTPGTIIDVKEFLKERYGEHFADHPKLERAAQNNGVTLLGLLTADAAAAAFNRGDFAALRRNTGRRCAIIRDLYRKALQGRFIVPTVETAASESKPGKKPKYLTREWKQRYKDWAKAKNLTGITQESWAVANGLDPNETKAAFRAIRADKSKENAQKAQKLPRRKTRQ